MPDGGILIVEDNQVNAMILRAMLRKRGYDPQIAVDGAEGVALSQSMRPRLVLMDLQMPRMDGFAAAAAILAEGRAGAAAGQPGEEPAIVAVTANPSAEVTAACLAAGFVRVLSKPVDFDELMDTVLKHVGSGG